MFLSGSKPCSIMRVVPLIFLAVDLSAAPLLAETPAAKIYDFSIPAGPLESVLNQFVRITSTNLSYADELPETAQSAGVNGRYPAEAALQTILSDTGVTAKPQNGGGFLLLTAPQATETQPTSEQQKSKTKTAEIQQDRMEMSLEAMTVTANKAEENIQDVPVSITAVDELMLEDKNIDTVRDLTDYVPNLILTDQGLSSSARPAMRGLLADVGSGISTAMFIDGIPVLGGSGYDTVLQDIERVEVLRGPQGTLYGKNAEAGVINIVTRQPNNDLHGKVSVDVGEDYKKEVALNVSGPIIQDKLFFGLSGQYYDKDGFIKNGYTGGMRDDKEHWYGKGQLRLTPTDDLDISFIFSQLEYDNDGSTIGLSEIGAAALGLTASGDREVYSGFDEKEESKGNAQALKVSYDFDDTLNLTSTTTHRFFNLKYAIDYDSNPAEIMHSTIDSETETISQELRLASNTVKMSWVAGIYYEESDSKATRESEGEAYALFGQLRYALTPSLGLTGGLRYESNDKDLQDPSTGNSFDGSWDDISPKFSVDYMP